MSVWIVTVCDSTGCFAVKVRAERITEAMNAAIIHHSIAVDTISSIVLLERDRGPDEYAA